MRELALNKMCPPLSSSAAFNERFTAAANRIVSRLLDDETPACPPILEASVHRSRRSRIWVAAFTGPAGGQIWKTTGLTDYNQALLLAKHWESEARAQRMKLGRGARKPGTRVRPAGIAGGSGPFTQKEVAQILGLSERAVREIERRALMKLRRDPLLKKLWDDFLSGALEERVAGPGPLTTEEVQALFDLALTAEELRSIEKAVRMTGHGAG